MEAALSAASELTPLASLMILAGLAASFITQLSKKSEWNKGQTQKLAVGVSIIVGALAYVISGLATGVLPATFVEGLSSAIVMIAGVAVCSRVAYSLLGHITDPKDDSAKSGE